MFDRDKVIESLIDNDIAYDSLLNRSFVSPDYFEYIMRHGFKGYDNYTDEELIQECNERDISYIFGDDS